MFSNMPVSKDYLSETELILFRTIFTKCWPFSPLSGIKPTFHSLITSENLPTFREPYYSLQYYWHLHLSRLYLASNKFVPLAMFAMKNGLYYCSCMNLLPLNVFDKKNKPNKHYYNQQSYEHQNK